MQSPILSVICGPHWNAAPFVKAVVDCFLLLCRKTLNQSNMETEIIYLASTLCPPLQEASARSQDRNPEAEIKQRPGGMVLTGLCFLAFVHVQPAFLFNPGQPTQRWHHP